MKKEYGPELVSTWVWNKECVSRWAGLVKSPTTTSANTDIEVTQALAAA